jgi:prepilin-type N-terminal cleavage/methylation domain-containing protein
MTKFMYTKNGGFTLIELAIVLVIIGVLVGSFIGTLGSRIDTTRRAEAQADLENIKTALLGFAFSSGGPYLPCPCTNDCDTDPDFPPPTPPGIENREADGTCSADAAAGYLGYLPWGTLGIKPADSWNSVYRYWVDPDFSDDGTGAGSVFDLADTGSGQVRTRSPDGAATPLVASNVVAVVFTQGKNTYGGLSALDGTARPAIPVGNVDEANNDDTNSEFVSRSPTQAGTTTAGGEFDDIVLWITDYEIKARMVEVGLLP